MPAVSRATINTADNLQQHADEARSDKKGKGMPTKKTGI